MVLEVEAKTSSGKLSIEDSTLTNAINDELQQLD